MAKKRLSRKELKEPDKVLTTLERAVTFLGTHRRVVAIVIGAVVVLTALGIFYRVRSQSQAEKASDLLRKGMETYAASIDPAVKPGEKGEGGSFHDVAARAKAALKIFDEVVSQYEGYGAARVAHLYRGRCYYDLKRFSDAAAAFRKVLDTKPGGGCGCGGGDEAGSDGLQAVALENLGYALAAQGKLRKAEQTFEKLRVLDHGTRRDWALYHKALLRERRGDLRGAIAAYEKISKAQAAGKKPPALGERSPLEDLARKRARYLRAKLEAGEGASTPRPRRAPPSAAKGATPAMTAAPGMQAAPAMAAAPAKGAAPAMAAAPAKGAAPAMATAPAKGAAPAMATAPGMRAAPGMAAAPGPRAP